MKTHTLIIISILLVISCHGQSNLKFNDLLDQLNSTNRIENNKLIENFLQRSTQTPLIEESTVIFLAKQKVGEIPKLLADFNGFMNSRYVKDSTLAFMKLIPNSDWYYVKKALEQDAIINYQFQYGSKNINDPLNTQTRIIFDAPISYIRMPEHQFSTYILENASIKKGQIIEETYQSKYFDKPRIIQIYLPPNYNSENIYPSAYFHDGSFFLKEANPKIVLDNLITQKKIKPLIAVFINPEIRGKEYRNDEGFGLHIQHELIPYITKKFNSTNNQRAVIGFSRGGLSSLYLAHKLEAFSHCGAFSPAIHPKSVEEFTAELEAYKYQSKSIFLTRSTHDKIWHQDAAELKDYFLNKASLLNYLEINEGHNIPAWSSLLDEMLIEFFPYKSD